MAFTSHLLLPIVSPAVQAPYHRHLAVCGIYPFPDKRQGKNKKERWLREAHRPFRQIVLFALLLCNVFLDGLLLGLSLLLFVGEKFDDGEFARLAMLAISPIDDVRASAWYRSTVVKNLVQRTLNVWRKKG